MNIKTAIAINAAIGGVAALGLTLANHHLNKIHTPGKQLHLNGQTYDMQHLINLRASLKK